MSYSGVRESAGKRTTYDRIVAPALVVVSALFIHKVEVLLVVLFSKIANAHSK
jgi:hypothetical protein